jgi:hypothetical protein
MAEPSDSVPVLVNDHFNAALGDWTRIGERMRTVCAVADNVLLIERPVSVFMLTWMRDLRAFQKQFGSLFGRKKQPPLADDFTAAVALCLEQFLAARGYPGSVRCEETTHKKRGATRPDVSVLSDANLLVATIECKTNLGWNRKGWKDQCEARNASLVGLFPGCTSYMCVLSQKNWNSEEFLNSPFSGKEWFCLSKVGVGKIGDPADAILHPIESMFLGILARLNK